MANFNKYDHLHFHIKEPVLDIGGGKGEMMEYFDVDDATIVDFKYADNGYKYIQADLSQRLPTIDRKFKTIFLFEVIEHIRNPLYLMSQVFDLLDDDGVCYISAPYTKVWPTHHHVCNWTLREIKTQMDKLGFDVEVLWKRRRFKNIGFWLPHCWFTLALTKRLENGGGDKLNFYGK